MSSILNLSHSVSRFITISYCDLIKEQYLHSWVNLIPQNEPLILPRFRIIHSSHSTYWLIRHIVHSFNRHLFERSCQHTMRCFNSCLLWVPGFSSFHLVWYLYNQAFFFSSNLAFNTSCMKLLMYIFFVRLQLKCCFSSVILLSTFFSFIHALNAVHSLFSTYVYQLFFFSLLYFNHYKPCKSFCVCTVYIHCHE